MFRYPPTVNNDVMPSNVDDLEIREWNLSSQCNIYTLVRRKRDGHVFRYWQGEKRELLIPEGFEEFYTSDHRPYMIAQRIIGDIEKWT